MRYLFSSIALALSIICLMLLMGQVFGPTTRTPRLTVSPGDLVVDTGNASVQGTLTVAGDSTVNGVLNANGGCTGCEGLINNVFGTALVNGCLNDPAIQFEYVQAGRMVWLTVDDGILDVSCTSDGTDLSTLAGAVPIDIRPNAGFSSVTAKYTPLSIAGVQTDACIEILVDGTLRFRTGVACGTLPGNVAKVVTNNIQNTVMYYRQF